MSDQASCPTVSAVRDLLYSDPQALQSLASEVSSVDDMRSYLSQKGLDLAQCDQVELTRLLRDYFLALTDDDLLAATGGEIKITPLTAVVIGSVVAGAAAAAIGGGVGAGVYEATH